MGLTTFSTSRVQPREPWPSFSSERNGESCSRTRAGLTGITSHTREILASGGIFTSGSGSHGQFVLQLTVGLFIAGKPALRNALIEATPYEAVHACSNAIVSLALLCMSARRS
jgi:hypothetical protein